MATIKEPMNWKSFYASDVFNWQQTEIEGRTICYRRLGIVENQFDLDGTDYEGRADLNMNSTIEVKAQVTDNELRHRIVLAWSYLRHQHPLLGCKSLYGEEFSSELPGRRWIDKCFVYERPYNRDRLIETASKHITFVQDSYPDANIDDFYVHLTNTGRAFNEKESLSRLIVMPFQRSPSGNTTLSVIIVAGHEVADGITTFRWVMSFINMLNMKEQDILHCIDTVCSEGGKPITSLPPAQESLYQIHATTAAKDRWNWAITRVLRHVHQPPPASFPNPLQRDEPLKTAARMLWKYQQVLDYTRVPPLNGYWIGADLSQRATNNLIKLCRQAGISVGSGAFTLVGIVMMRFEEARKPGIPYWERLPFVGSFPVNPRPFLSGTSTSGKEDSLMLAFSEGVTLPFVPSQLDLRKTFRVLGRLAHRQLRQYQKRRRTAAEEAHLGSRSPRQLLPALYLSTLERVEGKAKLEQRVHLDPQGTYPARKSSSLATCGISSVGDRASLIASTQTDVALEASDAVARFSDLRTAVRPRDGEFLVGAIGTKESMQFRVSYDGSAIDPKKAEAWKEAIKSILDFEMEQDSAVAKPILTDVGKLSKL